MEVTGCILPLGILRWEGHLEARSLLPNSRSVDRKALVEVEEAEGPHIHQETRSHRYRIQKMDLPEERIGHLDSLRHLEVQEDKEMAVSQERAHHRHRLHQGSHHHH